MKIEEKLKKSIIEYAKNKRLNINEQNLNVFRNGNNFKIIFTGIDFLEDFKINLSFEKINEDTDLDTIAVSYCECLEKLIN